MLLRLNKDDWWPSRIRERLVSQNNVLLLNEHMEGLIELEPFRAIAEELESFIAKHRVVGYHCTRALEPSYFELHGLRVLERQQHQAEFLERFGAYFSLEERHQMQQDWDAYYPGQQDRCRNGMLWFCLAPDQVVGSGADRLFTYFGGEAIYVPIAQRPSIAEKLRAIGKPVVVEVSINPQELYTFSRFPFAIYALSLFHRRKNPNACIHGREGYLKRNVVPDEIVSVIPRDSFCAAHLERYSSKSSLA